MKTESIFSEEWLPLLSFPSQLMGHLTHGGFVLLQHFQRSALGELACLALPLCLQPTFEKRVVVTVCRERGVSARGLTLAFFGPSGKKDGSVVAEFKFKLASPGLTVFVESVNRMLVDVDPVQPTTGESVLMRMQGLEGLLEVMIFDEE